MGVFHLALQLVCSLSFFQPLSITLFRLIFLSFNRSVYFDCRWTKNDIGEYTVYFIYVFHFGFYDWKSIIDDELSPDEQRCDINVCVCACAVSVFMFEINYTREYRRNPDRYGEKSENSYLTHHFVLLRCVFFAHISVDFCVFVFFGQQPTSPHVYYAIKTLLLHTIFKWE